MEVKIYRGSSEVGGTCIELKSANGKILWLDAGMPLTDENPKINYIKNKADAVMISHPHQDHYGLIRWLNKSTPIYIGQVGLDFINAVPKFADKVPLVKGDFQLIKPWESFVICDTFKVTPYLMDHSTPESFSFLIEVDGKKVFYSGDFRATGRKKALFNSIIISPPQGIDLLFMEGTMIKRSNYKYNDEESIEQDLIALLKEQTSTSFLISSAQNIDRLVTCYRACKRTRKSLVIDIYTSWLLELLKKVSSNVPTIDSKEVKVFCSVSQLGKLKNDIDFKERVKRNVIGEDLFLNPDKYLVFTRCPSPKLIDKLTKTGKVNIVYSQWKGYLENEFQQWFTPIINEYIDNSKKSPSKLNVEFMHTSGHAKLEDLVTFADAIKARSLVPIHTAYPSEFKKELEKRNIKNIELWEDNKTYKIN